MCLAQVLVKRQECKLYLELASKSNEGSLEYNTNNMSVKKFIVFLLFIISVALIGLKFRAEIISSMLKPRERAGLRVFSDPSGAEVFINGEAVGKTPYEDQSLLVADYKLKLKNEKNSWEAQVSLNPGVITVVTRDIAEASASAGQILNLEKGKGVTIVSSPTGAEVEIDSRAAGQTPISLDLNPGEHIITLKKPSYLNRSIRAIAVEGFNLIINADLAISEADLTQVSTQAILETPKLIVKSTPTGFLRVREKFTINSLELAKVYPGDELVLLEELEGWDRVRLPSGREGYVSRDFVEKKPLDK